MSVPKALQYATSSFPISRNTFKLTPYSVQNANPGDALQVSMPANSVVDLSTLSLFGLVAASTPAGAVQLPPNVESLLDSVYWTVNGQQLTNSFPLYSVLANAFLDWQGGDKINMRKVLQNSAPLTAAPTQPTDVYQACWNNWLGLPSSATTKMIDTSAIGDLRLHIRFAPAGVLSTSAAATAPTYSVSNLYATIDCISVDDGGLYQSLLQKRLESGPLEVAFTDFYTFNMGTVNMSSFTGRFSVASASLDAVHCTALPAGYTNVATASLDTVAQTSGYFTRGIAGATWSPGGGGVADFQNQLVTLNNVNYPAYGPISLHESWNQTAIAMGEHNNLLGQVNPLMNSMGVYLNNFLWITTRFNSPGDASEASVRTGQDTRGNAAFGTWQVTVLGSPAYTPVVFVQTTKVWAIAAGRQSQITA